MKNLIATLILSVLLYSCGMQQRLLSTKTKTIEAKQIIAQDTNELDGIITAVVEKNKEDGFDSSISNRFNEIIRRLKKNLEETEKTVQAVDFFLEKKSNFTRSNYDSKLGRYVRQLDSFNLNRNKRDRIYELLNEAVKVKAFEKYGLGAFFDPGVYKITPSGLNRISRSFLPAIDSLAALSNRYADVKRSIHIVIVGYADELPFSTETPLYKELKNYLKVEEPTRPQLNLVLSDLRAAELMRNLKTVMRDNASKFTSFNQLTIGSTSYGRGEAFPFKSITNYTDNDDRRRVVVFYWAILPILDNL